MAGTSRRAAELIVQADLRSQEAEGAPQTAWIAEHGETWAPMDRDAEFAESFGLLRSA